MNRLRGTTTNGVGKVRLTQHRTSRISRRDSDSSEGNRGPYAGRRKRRDAFDPTAALVEDDSQSLLLLTSNRGSRPFHTAVAVFLALSLLIAFSSETEILSVGSRHRKGGAKQALRHPARIAENWGERCVVNVHGIHHSGTGFVRDALYEGLGREETSKMSNTPKSQNEGQHAQTLYPSDLMRTREKSLCMTEEEVNNPLAWGKVLYCPPMVIANAPDNASKNILHEWSTYWDLKKPYLLQKSPTMDVHYLEMAIRSTGVRAFHVVVMRHPFAAHPYDWTPYYPDVVSYEATSLLFVWLDIWTHTLELLASEKVPKFGVVQYEAMVAPQQQTTSDISALVHEGCEIDEVLAKTQESRRLETREKDLDEIEARTQEKVVFHQGLCMKHRFCLRLMKDLKPIIEEFGYSWDVPLTFESRDSILFSYKKLPNEDLLMKMKVLVDHYKKMDWYPAA